MQDFCQIHRAGLSKEPWDRSNSCYWEKNIITNNKAKREKMRKRNDAEIRRQK